jgi:hypothetical protein
MATTTFDTLGYFKQLTSAGMPEPLADIHAEMLRKVIEDRLSVDDKNSATKADILAVKTDIQALETKLLVKQSEIIVANATLKHDLLKWMIGLLIGQTALVFTILRIMGVFNK